MSPLILIAALVGQDFNALSPDAPAQFNFDMLSPGEMLTPSPPIATKRQTVLVYTTPNCEPCRRMKAEVSSLVMMPGYPLFDFIFIPEKGRHPAWVATRLAAGDAYPFIDYNSKAGDWVFQSGWTDFETFLGKWERGKSPATQVALQPRPPSPPQPRYIQRSASLTYGMIPSVWDWPGDLRHHLSHSPHNYDYNSLHNMSDAQVVALHDSWHQNHQGRASAQAPRHRGFFGLRRAG